MAWKITFDPAKRHWTLRERGLDFAWAEEVFAGETIDIPDLRHDYGEARINSVGYLRGRMVIICWTPRGKARHIISMRKTNAREKTRFGKRHEEG
ncbi:MAG: BrnT family toxin [Pseudolabrys sp.]